MQVFKQLVLRGILLSGTPHLFRWWNRERAAILMFHGLTDRQHEGLENCQHKHLHVKRFEAFLKHLKDHFQVIPLDELIRCLRLGIPVPKSSVVLTFDDGFLSNYTLAFPLLKKYEAPATIFLATEFVSEKKPIWVDRVDYALDHADKTKAELVETKKKFKSMAPEDLMPALQDLEASLGHRLENSNAENAPPIYRALDWEHVREMQDSGLVTLAAHTHCHWILGRCRAEVVKAEVQKSKEIIEQETGRPCIHFCYPNGSREDFSAETENIIQSLGFESTMTTLCGFTQPGESPFLLKRFGITDDMDLMKFQLLMSGMDRNQV